MLVFNASWNAFAYLIGKMFEVFVVGNVHLFHWKLFEVSFIHLEFSFILRLLRSIRLIRFHFFLYLRINIWYGTHLDDKCCSVTNAVRFNADITTHFLYKIFTYAQSQTRTSLVQAFVVADGVEFYEKFGNVFFSYASTVIFDQNLVCDVV